MNGDRTGNFVKVNKRNTTPLQPVCPIYYFINQDQNRSMLVSRLYFYLNKEKIVIHVLLFTSTNTYIILLKTEKSITDFRCVKRLDSYLLWYYGLSVMCELFSLNSSRILTIKNIVHVCINWIITGRLFRSLTRIRNHK